MNLPILYGPLRYLIGRSADSIPSFLPGQIVEVPYDYVLTSDVTQYGNLRDELGSRNFKPYLPSDDITDRYGERTPDPKGPGYLKNVEIQIRNAVHLHRTRIEWDNPDSRGLLLDSVVVVQDLTWARGLRTVAKNPFGTSNPARYVSHPSVDLCVVERGDFGSDIMENLRGVISQPLLAVRFVGYKHDDQDDEHWCRAVAANIKAKGYLNMGVTFSPHGEYTSSQDIIVPQ